MDPYYRFFIFKNPLFMISWNALLACDINERMAEVIPSFGVRSEVSVRHTQRLIADGIDMDTFINTELLT